jgi:DNA-binding PadR family transcriptional regulator
MAAPDTDPTAMLPLSEPVLHILLTLAGGARHGYGIMVEVEERTEGRVRLGPGTLYGAVKRLRERGLIEEVEAAASPEEAGDDRRRTYRLTPLGREVTRLEVARLERLVETARVKRLASEGGAS